ncbi:MAG: hypothetical protein R2941_08170 [Desulfobacterales bacterium]
MLSLNLNLPQNIEKQFWNIVHGNYQGDSEAAITDFLKLHEKYGWKEQLLQDVKSVRSEVRKKGGISEKTIENAVKKYRIKISG